MGLVWGGMPIEEMNERQLRGVCQKLSDELANLLIEQAKQQRVLESCPTCGGDFIVKCNGCGAYPSVQGETAKEGG